MNNFDEKFIINESPEQYMRKIKPVYILYVNAVDGYVPEDADIHIIDVDDYHHEIEFSWTIGGWGHYDNCGVDCIIPIGWIRKYYKDPEATTIELKQLAITRKETERNKKEQEEQKRKEEQVKKQRETDLATLKRLKEKYEGT